jgi:hypothetical protein
MNRLTLTPGGLEYLFGTISEPVSALSKYAGPVLNFIFSLLSRLPGASKELQGLSAGRGRAIEPEELMGRILALPRFRFMDGGGLRISVLREVLAEYSSESVDAALMSLFLAGRIALSPFADPAMITQADRSGALFLGGQVRHYLHVR